MRPVHLPQAGKVCCDNICIASDKNAERNQPQEGSYFRDRENILNNSSGSKTADIDECENDNAEDCKKLSGGNISSGKSEEDILFAEPRDKNGGKFCKCNGNCSNRPRLYHKEKSPSVQKTDERVICFPEVHILSAGMRHHTCQLTVTQRRNN